MTPSNQNNEEKKCCEKCRNRFFDGRGKGKNEFYCSPRNCPCHSSPEVPSSHEEERKEFLFWLQDQELPVGFNIGKIADKHISLLSSAEQRGYGRGVSSPKKVLKDLYEWIEEGKENNYTTSLEKHYKQEALQSLKEKVGKEIEIIEEGIQACKDDSKKEECKGEELQYIFGKSQALKIMKLRFLTLLENEQI